MSEYRFTRPIEVRYGDLDPQGHVNNSRYLTYFEQARISYMQNLGYLQIGKPWKDFGFILAEVRLSFLKPVQYGSMLQAGIRVVRLGNKSLSMDFGLTGSESGELMCTGSAVMVAYDYQSNQTIPLPIELRKTIRDFEGIEEDGET